MYKLSQSAISLMNQCKRCFYLTKKDIWKRPQGIFPSLPNGMDKILKTHFNNFRNKNNLPPELCEDQNCDNIKLFDNTGLLNIWQNNRKGIRWEDSNGNVFTGAVDEILIKDSKLIVLDFKTRGYPCKEDTADTYQNQLDIYNLLLRKNGHETEDFAFLLFYVPSSVEETGEVIFDTELKTMKVNVSNAENLFKQALELLNGSCPKETCEWCEKVVL